MSLPFLVRVVASALIAEKLFGFVTKAPFGIRDQAELGEPVRWAGIPDLLNDGRREGAAGGATASFPQLSRHGEVIVVDCSRQPPLLLEPVCHLAGQGRVFRQHRRFDVGVGAALVLAGQSVGTTGPDRTPVACTSIARRRLWRTGHCHKVPPTQSQAVIETLVSMSGRKASLDAKHAMGLG